MTDLNARVAALEGKIAQLEQDDKLIFELIKLQEKVTDELGKLLADHLFPEPKPKKPTRKLPKP